MKKLLCAVLLMTVFMFAACAKEESQPAEPAAPGETPAAEEQQPAEPKEKVFLTIPSATMGGTYYTYTAGVGQILNEHSEYFDVTVNASAGSMENVSLLKSGEAEFAPLNMSTASFAVAGTNGFDAPVEMQTAFTMYTSWYHIATLDPNVASVNDLKGKKVSVGVGGSTMEIMGRIVLEAYGILDDVELYYYSAAETATALKEGTIDACMVLLGQNWSALTEIAARNDVYLVPIDESLVATINEAIPVTVGSFPAGMYGIESDVPALVLYEAMFVRPDVAEDVVYDFVKTVFDNLDELHAIHPVAEETTLESQTVGLAVKMHPGAVKYFEECGLDIPAEYK